MAVLQVRPLGCANLYVTAAMISFVPWAVRLRAIHVKQKIQLSPWVCVLVTQSYPVLCDPMGHTLSVEFSRQE